jgi:hypothetical protein
MNYRGVRLITLTDYAITELLKGTAKIRNPLPSDAEPLAARYDPVTETYTVKVASGDFETVPEGGVIPFHIFEVTTTDPPNHSAERSLPQNRTY